MPESHKERRKYKRYNTEVKIYFDYAYDLQTKVEFELVQTKKKKAKSKKYSAISRNISVEGICIVSDKKLKKDDKLYLEVYLPNAKNPIFMEGVAQWSQLSKSAPGTELSQENKKYKYHAGIQLTAVNGVSVKESIYYDKEYKVDWSIVMESVFDNYKLLMGGKYKNPSK